MSARGAVVWFTGLPASGKTTLAHRVKARLDASGRPALVLDSDELRDALAVTAYDAGPRGAFYRAVAGLAVIVARQGLVALVAATAAKRAARDLARARLGGLAPFYEVWVDTPLAECESRDPKALYAAARRGELPDFPGIGVPFEPPLEPEVCAAGGWDAAALDQILALLPPPPVS